MKPSTALAIVTYVDAARPSDVGRRLPEALATLEKSEYTDPVIIVDDGSTCEKHQAFLGTLERSSPYQIIHRKCNGGISRAKNTGLRALCETGADVGFLAEDDILFANGWDTVYADTMRRSKIHHFSWYLPDEANRIVACNDALVTMTAGLLGLLMTFTREVLETVGGFKVLPHRYGYEHINWTIRAIQAGFAPFGADICDSWNFVQRNTHPPSLAESEIQAGAAINLAPGYEIAQIYEALVE